MRGGHKPDFEAVCHSGSVDHTPEAQITSELWDGLTLVVMASDEHSAAAKPACDGHVPGVHREPCVLIALL